MAVSKRLFFDLFFDLGVLLYFIKLAIFLFLLLNYSYILAFGFIFLYLFCRWLLLDVILGLTQMRGLDPIFFLDKRRPCIIAAATIYDKIDAHTLAKKFINDVYSSPDCKNCTKSVVKFFGEYYWSRPQKINFYDHVNIISTPMYNEEQILEFCAGLLYKPLPYDKPMWEINIIENYQDDKTVAIGRMNHALGDGMSNVFAFSRIHDNYQGLVQRLVKVPFHIKLKTWLLMPIYMPYKLLQIVFSNADNFAFKQSDLSYETKIGATALIELSKVKDVSKKLNIKINDFLTGCICNGIQRYFEEKATKPLQDKIQISIPMTLRDPLDKYPFEFCNDITLISFQLPFYKITKNNFKIDGVKNMMMVSKGFNDLKRSLFPLGMYYFYKIGSRLFPASIISLLTAVGQGKINFLLSNMAGSPVTLKMNGADFKETFLFLNLFGMMPATFIAFSYNNRIRITCCVDSGVVNDPMNLSSKITDVIFDYIDEFADEETPKSNEEKGRTLRGFSSVS